MPRANPPRRGRPSHMGPYPTQRSTASHSDTPSAPPPPSSTLAPVNAPVNWWSQLITHLNTIGTRLDTIGTRLDTIETNARTFQARTIEGLAEVRESIACSVAGRDAEGLWRLTVPSVAHPARRLFNDGAYPAIFNAYRQSLVEYKNRWARHTAVRLNVNPEQIELNGLGFGISPEIHAATTLTSPVAAHPQTTTFGHANFATQLHPNLNTVILLEATTAPIGFNQSIVALTEHNVQQSPTTLYLCQKLFQVERQLAFLRSFYGPNAAIVVLFAVRGGQNERIRQTIDAALNAHGHDLPLLTQVRNAQMNQVSRFQVI